MNTPTTLAELLAANQIKMTCERISVRTDGASTFCASDARHWLCVFRYAARPGKAFSCEFSQGSAHTVQPKADEVLDCLIMDCDALDKSFEEWADDFGYDTDSISAKATYEACRKLGKKLVAFLGKELFAQMVACERL